MEILVQRFFHMFILCELLVGLCLPAVIASSDREHCLVLAPSDEDTDPCPPWFIQQKIAGDSMTVECFCGPPTYGITCNSKTCSTSLFLGRCVTYDTATTIQVGGGCVFDSKPERIILLPKNVTKLNDFMCGKLNREGQLCGTCKKGYGPALITYDLECADCSKMNYGWVLYTFLEVVPITLFYLIIVTFQVNVTSGFLNAFVLFAQVTVDTISFNHFPYLSQSWSQVIQQTLIICYGFWNLDFFRSVIPPFCVSDNITTLHVLALQYLPAFYPLLLVVVTYILIELHDKNVRVVVWLWRPFRRCLAPFLGRWDPKASIVSTFATFLILAYNKLILASLKLLHTTEVTDIRGNSSHYMLFAPTIPYFGNEHFPFAILAITVLSTFIALPQLLLIVYPTKPFQKLLSCIKIRWHALHIFADVFHGCYKNQTDSKHDCRYFAAFYFVIRIVVFVGTLKQELKWTIHVVCYFTGSLLFALLRPYKKSWLNILDSLILALLAFISLGVLYNLETQEKWFQLTIFMAALPLVYFVTYALYTLLSWLGVLQKCQQQLRNIQQSLQQRLRGHNFRQQEPFDVEQLPDRMVNPDDYYPLPQNGTEDESDDNSETEILPVIGAYTNDYGTM